MMMLTDDEIQILFIYSFIDFRFAYILKLYIDLILCPCDLLFRYTRVWYMM